MRLNQGAPLAPANSSTAASIKQGGDNSERLRCRPQRHVRRETIRHDGADQAGEREHEKNTAL